MAADRRALAAFYDHYGRWCACCGEDNPLFLSIDHVNGRTEADFHPITEFRHSTTGNKRPRTGVHAAKQARREGYPDTYQVLCFNCNCGKNRNGGVCPHRQTSTLALVQ